MKTTNEFIDYCKENDTGTMNEKAMKKGFPLIEDMLMKDEIGKVAFTGIKDFVSMTKHDGSYCFLVTNKRILMSEKILFKENTKSVSLKHLNDFSLTTEFKSGIIVFDTIKDKFNVFIQKQQAQNVFNLLHEALDI